MAVHGIPAIDRALDVLDCLAASPEPLSIRDITERTGLVRTTVYRSLNSLVERALVRQASEKTYVLGGHLLKLARAVPQGMDLVEASRSILNALAVRLGTSAKLSLLDGQEALVVAVAESPGVYSITTQVGRRFPLHAGAASKLLLAQLPPEARNGVLARRLEAFTPKTITDPKALAEALEVIRETGLAHDNGEYVVGVRATAAAVRDRSGVCIAALSVPYSDTAENERIAEVTEEVAAAADKLSISLNG